jgi:hypothetical protein
MKKIRLLFCLIFFSLFGILTPYSYGNKQSLDAFLSQVKLSIESRDVSKYLSLLSPGIRSREEAFFVSSMEDLGFDTVSVFKPQEEIQKGNSVNVYFQVLYQNEYSSRIEIWRLDLQRNGGTWRIVNKTITGDVSNFYKLNIPSDRVEWVDSIEIQHQDIQMSFQNALVFYDNIPHFETALLVIGKGRLKFSPSIEREKHQLELVFSEEVLEDDLNYAFLRFSNSYFLKNIKIKKSQNSLNSISEVERNEALAIFSLHYPRSFTFENSLTGELFSLLPQGDETVFEFSCKRKGIFTYIYQPATEEEVCLYEWRKKRTLNIYSPARETEGRRMFVRLESQYDIQNYKIDIDFKPQDKYILGRALIRFESKRKALNRMQLKLNPEFEILRISDDKQNSLFYTQDKLRSNLFIYFMRPVDRNEKRTIEIFYRGILEPPELFFDVGTKTQVNETTFTYISPPKFDSYLYSESAFWYPAPNDGDYFTSTVKFVVPAKYSVVSNGNLVDQFTEKAGGDGQEVDESLRSAYVFQTINPVKYLTFIVGRFRKISEENSGVHVDYFRTQDARPMAFDIVSEASEILAFYADKFGPYPFDKFKIAHRIWLQSGGHSPPSFVVLMEFFRHPGGKKYILKSGPVNLVRYREYFLAHEIAHQWWGQGVGWETYQDQWLSEGLAQFSTILYLKNKYGKGVYLRLLRKFADWTEKKSNWGQITLGSRISFFDFEAYQTIIYNKVSVVLNMLKDILGEDVFFQGIQEFFKRNKYSTARSRDFFNVMNEMAESNLKPFFDGWFNSYRLPEVFYSHKIEEAGNGYDLEFSVNQREGIFVVPLDVQWEENKKKIKRQIIVSKKAEKFVFHLENKPKKIKINQDKIVPGRFTKNCLIE